MGCLCLGKHIFGLWVVLMMAFRELLFVLFVVLVV